MSILVWIRGATTDRSLWNIMSAYGPKRTSANSHIAAAKTGFSFFLINLVAARDGVLVAVAADDPELQARIAAFRWGLQQLGWIGADRTLRNASETTGMTHGRQLAQAVIA
jgi:hypothetical protein